MDMEWRLYTKSEMDKAVKEAVEKERERCYKLVNEEFIKHRFNEKTHLGLGDIRLTMGSQENVVSKISSGEEP